MSSNKQEIKNRLLDALPQLQCRKCTYKDCESYADAITNKGESLDKCEPGSKKTQKQLFMIMQGSKDKVELNTIKKYSIAEIKHEDCIGCTICIKICPVDAIIGARHKIHFIINDQCNGCELCITECPVDCMKMVTNANEESWHWPSKKTDLSMDNYNNKKLRLDNQKKEKILVRERLASDTRMKSYIEAALLREEKKHKKIKEYE